MKLHQLTHIPAVPWCRACVAGRCCESPHISQIASEEFVTTSVVSLDFVFLDLFDITSGEGTLPTLALCDENITKILGLMVPTKGPEPYAVRGVCDVLQKLGYTRMVIQYNGEPSISALVTAVQKEWPGDSENVQQQLIPPTDDHASTGAVEAMVRSLEKLTKTSKVCLEEDLGVSILPSSPILPWLVRQQRYLRNRLSVRSSGKTPYEELTMLKFQSPLLNFGEAVLTNESVSR